MKLRLTLAAVFLGASLASPAGSFAQNQRTEWNRPLEPFLIIGNVHYVGTAGLAAYLITGPEGHVLIDGGSEESAAQIAASIRRLGFRLEDVRYILNNHAHWDHAGGLAELKRLSGARLVASAGDAPDLAAGSNPYRDDLDRFAPVAVDQIIDDGEAVRVGPVSLDAQQTPGHTRGCTSWSTEAVTGGRTYRVLFACSLTVAGQPLVDDPRYPEAAEDFRRSYDRLSAMQADVFLGFHGNQFGLEEKRDRRAAGDPLAFVDPDELQQQIARARAAFEAELVRQRAAARE